MTRGTRARDLQHASLHIARRSGGAALLEKQNYLKKKNHLKTQRTRLVKEDQTSQAGTLLISKSWLGRSMFGVVPWMMPVQVVAD